MGTVALSLESGPRMEMVKQRMNNKEAASSEKTSKKAPSTLSDGLSSLEMIVITRQAKARRISPPATNRFRVVFGLDELVRPPKSLKSKMAATYSSQFSLMCSLWCHFQFAHDSNSVDEEEGNDKGRHQPSHSKQDVQHEVIKSTQNR